MDFRMEYIHQPRDMNMKNPFHRFTNTNGLKVDVNMSAVRGFHAQGEGTRLVFTDGSTDDVQESPRTVRGAARKTWPDQTTTTDHIVDGEAA